MILQDFNAFLSTDLWEKVTGHEITLKILQFILNSIEKVKPAFSFFLNQMGKIPNGPKGGPHGNEFWQFSYTKIIFLNS